MIDEPIDLAYVDCVKEEYPKYRELLVPKLAFFSRHGIHLAPARASQA